MKQLKVTILLIASFMATNAWAQDLKTIKLNAPDKTRGAATMKAISERRSVREYDSKELSLQDLSDLLWAANGVSSSDRKRTAPTAMNRQEIDVYVIREDGTYLYDAQAHALNPLTKGDFRSAVAGSQDFVKTAPVCLVMVINLKKLGDPNSEQTKLMGAVDAGNVSQNVNLFCSAVGLATVPRATMDKAKLKEVLKLDDTQLPLMNNPVGYPKK